MGAETFDPSTAKSEVIVFSRSEGHSGVWKLLSLKESKATHRKVFYFFYLVLHGNKNNED